jgi:phosphate-selective porin OprO/OprP
VSRISFFMLRVEITLCVLCLLTPACVAVREVQAEVQDPVQEPERVEEAQDPGEPEEAEIESEILERRRGGLYDGLEPEEETWKGTRFYWDLGPRLDTLGGDLAVIFGGRLQVDGATFREDEEINAAFGSPEEGFEVRRFFLELGALYKKRYEFRFMLDLANNVDYRDIFLGMIGIPYLGGIRAGYFKEPFGLEEVESSNDITFLERSLTDALVDRRNLGVMIHRIFPGARRGTLSLGAFREANNELDTDDGRNVTGRITALPWYGDEGRRLLHLGVAGSYRIPTDDTARFKSRPESSLAQTLVDTGPFAADKEVRFGLEAAQVWGPLSLQSEFMASSVDGKAGVGDPFFHAFYFMGSYILTGEYRRYRRNVGAFGRVHPDSNRGAWEAIGRYSYLDLDSEGIEGGVLHGWTAGLNVYVNFNTKLMLNYVLAHPEGFDYEHIFQLRFQLTL